MSEHSNDRTAPPSAQEVMGTKPAPTSERLWLCYLGCVTIVALCTDGAGMADHDPSMFLLVQAPVLLAVLVSYWLAVHRSHEAPRYLRAGLALIGRPLVFSALCWLLPSVHPDPYDYVWLDFDRWLFGDDIARYSDNMPPWLIEVLQLDYAAFYGLCIASALLVGLSSGRHAFDRAVLLIVGGFLSSYLGYLLVPTIAPKLVLEHPHELTGLWFTQPVRESIDAMEANHWDCFPSGHTLLALTNLIMLWRWARRWFWILLLPSVGLILSTILLRYHWASDVVVGALWAWPCARLCDSLADRDGWPAPRPN
jgi:membrane-associated phospholipid phosphatase